MNTTVVAGWLNSVFATFDLAILGALHALAEPAGFLLTPLFEIVSLLGEKGACFSAFAVALMLFKRTRWTGICLFVAVCLGALMTNILLKDFIARPRPFESSELYADWWRFVGAPAEDGFSFPSGHMTAASAAMTAWMIVRRSAKATACGLSIIVAMGMARCYLVAHYPSDVLAGCFVGALCALISWLLVSKAREMLERRRSVRGSHVTASR
ncbi:MAG: phosphatase PAP2 family protein, partial [Gordonibacter sp.]|uniref:phosphatase PAP2 family protein n=1 Tax=Gordonibacter sp. TaxID=1968902 RepID=UPI002FC9304B